MGSISGEESETEDEDEDEKRNSLTTKLAALEFNHIPAVTFHELPHIIPTPVKELWRLLSRDGSGCGSIPESLRPIFETHPRLISEDFPHFVWDRTPMPDRTSMSDTLVPDMRQQQADLKLWERVQLIVNLTEKLRNTNAEEAAYHSLAQTTLEGTPLN